MDSWLIALAIVLPIAVLFWLSAHTTRRMQVRKLAPLAALLGPGATVSHGMETTHVAGKWQGRAVRVSLKAWGDASPSELTFEVQSAALEPFGVRRASQLGLVADFTWRRLACGDPDVDGRYAGRGAASLDSIEVLRRLHSLMQHGADRVAGGTPAIVVEFTPSNESFLEPDRARELLDDIIGVDAALRGTPPPELWARR